MKRPPRKVVSPIRELFISRADGVRFRLTRDLSRKRQPVELWVGSQASNNFQMNTWYYFGKQSTFSAGLNACQAFEETRP